MCGRCVDVDVYVGTLSKVVGVYGGFVVCLCEMKCFLVLCVCGYMFSMVFFVFVIVVVFESLRVFVDDSSIRVKFWRNVDRFNVVFVKLFMFVMMM